MPGHSGKPFTARVCIAACGTLWILSLFGAYRWAQSFADQAVARSGSADPAVAEGQADVSPLAHVARQTETLPPSVAYGFGQLQFTEALGEELLHLQSAGEEDYVKNYMLLDELTCALDAKGVLAALAWIEKATPEGSPISSPSARGHLSFRLGYLLKDAALEGDAGHLADGMNSLLGWTWSDPEGALAFATNPAKREAAGIDRWDVQHAFAWSASKNPDATLDWLLDNPDAEAGYASWRRVAEVVSQKGYYDSVEARLDRLAALPEAAPLIADYYLEAARGDPATYLSLMEDIIHEDIGGDVMRGGLQKLVQQSPHAVANALLNQPITDTVAHLLLQSFQYMDTREAWELVQAQNGGQNAEIAAFAHWTTQIKDDPRSALALVDSNQAPALIQRRVRSRAIGVLFAEAPEEAISLLRSNVSDFPVTVAAIHSGESPSHIRALFWQEIEDPAAWSHFDEHAAEDYLNSLVQSQE